MRWPLWVARCWIRWARWRGLDHAPWLNARVRTVPAGGHLLVRRWLRLASPLDFPRDVTVTLTGHVVLVNGYEIPSSYYVQTRLVPGCLLLCNGEQSERPLSWWRPPHFDLLGWWW